MQIGKLRHRVTLQARTIAKDSQGGSTETWADVVTVNAEILPVNGREAVQAAQMHAEFSTAVRIRHRSGVDPKDRITFDGRTMQIASVQDPDGRKRELRLLCVEVQS